uniref:DUF995 domain-containing protein n=1 Tax=Natrarchaeobaculum sulfurireducens TaxID=2044521 RepID=UPI0037433698
MTTNATRIRKVSRTCSRSFILGRWAITPRSRTCFLKAWEKPNSVSPARTTAWSTSSSTSTQSVRSTSTR